MSIKILDMSIKHPDKSLVLIVYCALFAICSVVFFSCKHADLTLPMPNENMRPAGDFLKNNYDFSLFYAALEYTGLADTLNGKGPFTVLAPDNQSFNELGIQFPEDFKRMNKDSLRQVMRYHILPRRLVQADVPVNGVDVRYMTLAGTELYTSFATYALGNTAYAYNKLYFSGSLAYRKDVPLANGILHVLNKVMKPYLGKTVQDWLSGHADYSIFVSGLKKFGLWDELAGTGPFTIFAPNNKAFADAGLGQSDIDTLNTSKYIGARLFGAYILYKKRYFLSDQIVFKIINNESFYTSFLRDDNSSLSFFCNEDGIYPNAIPYYSIVWLSSKKPLVEFDPTQVSVTVTGSIKDFARMDHLCENGVLHDMIGLLVNPGLAVKK
jgi:uncharacterized surface protein with fasciclin (FAS1) repeats